MSEKLSSSSMAGLRAPLRSTALAAATATGPHPYWFNLIPIVYFLLLLQGKQSNACFVHDFVHKAFFNACITVVWAYTVFLFYANFIFIYTAIMNLA